MKIKMEVGTVTLNKNIRACRLVKGYAESGARTNRRSLNNLIKHFGVHAEETYCYIDAERLGYLVGKRGLIG